MKICEIASSARKIIKKMESLFISYSYTASSDAETELWGMIQKYSSSDDDDLKAQSLHYKKKLFANLYRDISQ